jgi:AcrR family transcriptional regulator
MSRSTVHRRIVARARAPRDAVRRHRRSWSDHYDPSAVGYRHSREEIVAAAAEVALARGIAEVTFGKVAAHLGISDRMVVYYLPTKHDLVLAAASAIAADLQAVLDEAFGSARRDPDALVRAAWPVLTAPTSDRVFAVFFEIIGLAAAGRSPFDQLATAMMGAWADWLADRTTGSTPDLRRQRALAVMATLDGLLVLRQTLGADAADAAVGRVRIG